MQHETLIPKVSAAVISGDRATIDHEAIKAYRDTFLLTPNAGYRRDIILTVGEDMEIWRKVLANWKRPHWHLRLRRNFRWNPRNISGMLQEMVRRKQDAETERSSRRREQLPVYPELQWPKIQL